MASSPPSFDHLPSASAAEREPYAGYPIQAQICRNGQMKYQRTRAPTSDNEIVMPDGEIVCDADRSEEHTSELQSLMRISYAVFCLKKKKQNRVLARQYYKQQ